MESDELVGVALRQVAGRSLDLAERYPESREVARVVVAAALFAEDAEKSFAALERSLSPDLAGETDTAVRRVALFVYAVLRWNEPARLVTAVRLVDEIPSEGLGASFAGLLRAEPAAASWRLGAGATAEEVRDAYLAAVADARLPVEQRPRAMNNLGVVLAALGDPSAGERLRRSEESSEEDYDVPRFNRLALAASSPSPAADALENLRATMALIADDDEGQPATMRRQALRRLAWLADREDDAEAAQAFRERTAAIPSSPFFLDPARSDLGVLTRGEFQFGLGYSSLEGLVVNLDVWSWLWLLVPVP